MIRGSSSLCFAIPRIIEGIALFVVLPAMIVVGAIRGVFRQLK